MYKHKFGGMGCIYLLIKNMIHNMIYHINNYVYTSLTSSIHNIVRFVYSKKELIVYQLIILYIKIHSIIIVQT